MPPPITAARLPLLTRRDKDHPSSPTAT